MIVGESLHRDRSEGESSGFTLIELTIAVGLMLFVATAVGTFVATMWHSVTNSTERVVETQEAQRLSQTFETNLMSAVCVGAGIYSFPFISTGWQTSYSPYLAENCPQPGYLNATTNPANLISQASGSGTGNDQLYFWEAFNTATRCSGGSPPCADVEEAYLVSHSIGSFNTHWLALKDLRTGVVSYLGDYVSSLSFYYFNQATPSCTGTGIGVPQSSSVGPPTSPPGNDVGAVRFVVTIQNAASAPPVTYSTCIFLPND